MNRLVSAAACVLCILAPRAAAAHEFNNVDVALLGDANVWSTQIGKDAEANFGGGLQVASPYFFASLAVKSGSMGETSGAERNYGAFLLTPAAANLAVSLQGAWFFSEHLETAYRNTGGRFGIGGMLQAGGGDWSERSAGETMGDTAESLRKMNVVGFATNIGLTFAYGPIGDDCKRYLNCWELSASIGYANRTMMGDGRQNKSFRQNVLGYDSDEDHRPTWNGAFLSLRAGVSNVKIGMDIILLSGRDKILHGLTTGQLVPVINVSVPIALTRTPDQPAKAAGGDGKPSSVPATMSFGVQ